MVASRRIDRAMPIPRAFITMMSAIAKEPDTSRIITAALVTILPVRSSPLPILRVLSPVASYSSLMRDSMKTS